MSFNRYSHDSVRKIVLPVAPDHQPIGSIAWGVISGRFRRLNFMFSCFHMT